MISSAATIQGPDGIAPADSFITWKADEPVKLRKDDSNFASVPPITVVSLFEKIVHEHPEETALIDTYNDVHDTYTYNKYHDCVIHVAKAFIKLGLEKHHGVGILGYNSPQWLITHLASIYAGGLSAGIYATNSSEICQFIIDNSQSNIVVVENDHQLNKIVKVWPQLPELKAIIQYRGELKERRDGLYTWNDLLQMDVGSYEGELRERLNILAPNKCCSLIYTSGTTGNPKGVMVSHDNIVWTLNVLLEYVNEGQQHPRDVVVSYLPLNHIAALMVDVYWPLVTGGGKTYFSRPDALKGSLVKTLREARPTMFFGVPRVWEKFMENLIEVERKQNNKSDSNNTDANNEKETDAKNGAKGADVRPMLGLDRTRIALTGAAPCKLEVLDFFAARGIQIMEVYGMSESSGPHTINTHSSNKMGSVGKTISGFRTKLEHSADEGLEICMDGRHVFMGYLNDEMRTRETFDPDMWLHSGDVGTEDEDGFIHITARIKELIITAGGENVAPVPIENRLTRELPCISNCMVVGERRKFLSLLLTMKAEVDPSTGKSTDILDKCSREWCKNLGSKSTKVSEVINSRDPLVDDAIQRAIDRANEGAVSRAQMVQKWIILPKDFSIIGGELGPTLKMRRSEICKIYKAEIDSFYQIK